MADLPEDIDLVTVPRWALTYVLEHAAFDDEGPYEEGWRSEKMKRAVDALEESLR